MDGVPPFGVLLLEARPFSTMRNDASGQGGDERA